MKYLRLFFRNLFLTTLAYVVVWQSLYLALGTIGRESAAKWLLLVGAGGLIAVGMLWALPWRRTDGEFKWATLTWRRRHLAFTFAYCLIWPGAVLVASGLGRRGLSQSLNDVGVAGLFLLGLLWLIWVLERVTQRQEATTGANRVWNPLFANAWYFGRRSPRLSQSATALIGYSLGFMMVLLLLSQLGGCTRYYDMPAGGGKDMMKQTVRLQKIKLKKYVVNPFSSILFNPPPIEKIDPQLRELTKHRYKIGQGEGEGAGFGAGKKFGKIGFIRLEYEGGDWNQDFGPGGDLNLLIYYNAQFDQPVDKRTSSVTPKQLATYRDPRRSPPLIYLTGQGNIILSKSDKQILREYLHDKHGMIFGDNGGSRQFHNQFIALMRDLTGVQEVRVPLDDPIHTRPFSIPFLPYVSPHGGKDALGWKVDGRWVGYYHPGDIGDAWADGHSGTKREVYEACYQLGANVIFYAHAEYNKWLTAQEK